MDNCSHSSRQDGFAFIWTLYIVTLLAVGMGLAAEIYATNLQRAQENELLFIGNQFRQALASYYESIITSGKHEYPAELDDLLEDKRTPEKKRHLRKVFVDPMTGKAEWGFLRQGGRIVGIHSLSDKPPLKVANFEVENQAFTSKLKISEWVFTYPSNLLVLPEGAPPQLLDPTKPPPPIANGPASFQDKR